MNYRNLGRSGLKVSPLCLGTMMFGGPTDEATAARIVDQARDAGVNFVDTAERRRAVAPPHDRGLRGKPPAARDGLHRRLLPP